MKNFADNFGSILSILVVIWQDFVMFGRIHHAQSVILLWLAYNALVLLNSVATWCNTAKVLQKRCNLCMLVCMGVGRIFPG